MLQSNELNFIKNEQGDPEDDLDGDDDPTFEPDLEEVDDPPEGEADENEAAPIEDEEKGSAPNPRKKCDFCQRTFKSSGLLDKHRLLTHEIRQVLTYVVKNLVIF